MKLLEKLVKDVMEFRTAFGLPIGRSFTSELHESLIVEEMVELCDSNNIVDVADAIVDTVYVLVGRMVNRDSPEPIMFECFMIDILVKVADKKGIPFEQCWDEIHRSNMSKVCSTLDESDDTVVCYEAIGIDCDISKVGDCFVVKCKHDSHGEIKPGKVLKSINYSPANLSFLNK